MKLVVKDVKKRKDPLPLEDYHVATFEKDVPPSTAEAIAEALNKAFTYDTKVRKYVIVYK